MIQMSTINKVILDTGMSKASSAFIRRALRSSELDYSAWQIEGSADILLGISEIEQPSFAIVLTYTSDFQSVQDSIYEIREALEYACGPV
jgi:hypothetical protein